MPDPQAIANLVEVLADLYQTPAEAIHVAQSAGMDTTRIEHSGKPIILWDSILKEAIQTRRDDELLGVVLTRFGRNGTLRDAYVAYRADSVLQAQQAGPKPKVELKGSTVWIPLDIDTEYYEDRKLTLVRAVYTSPETLSRVPFYICHRPITFLQFVGIRYSAGYLNEYEFERARENYIFERPEFADAGWREAYNFCTGLTKLTGITFSLPSPEQWAEAPEAINSGRYGPEWLDTPDSVAIVDNSGGSKQPKVASDSSYRTARFRCVILVE